jgi:hypothetical protein
MLFQLDNIEQIWFKFSSLFLFNWLIIAKSYAEAAAKQ